MQAHPEVCHCFRCYKRKSTNYPWKSVGTLLIRRHHGGGRYCVYVGCLEVKGRKGCPGGWGPRRGILYVPDGDDNVDLPWKVVVGIIECKFALAFPSNPPRCRGPELALPWQYWTEVPAVWVSRNEVNARYVRYLERPYRDS